MSTIHGLLNISWLLFSFSWGTNQIAVLKSDSNTIPQSSYSLIIREMQIKTPMRYHLKSVRWLPPKRQHIANVDDDVEKQEHFLIIWGNVNWHGHYEKLYGDS